MGEIAGSRVYGCSPTVRSSICFWAYARPAKHPTCCGPSLARIIDRLYYTQSLPPCVACPSIVCWKRCLHDSMASCAAMEASELVQMLRCRARKTGTATSNYRGVSLLRQTRKWHAQINLGGRQVHLGFWATEEEAARAYDRAAINKGAREKSRILTNFDIKDYRNEVGILAALEANEVLDVLAVEMCASHFCRLRQ